MTSNDHERPSELDVLRAGPLGVASQRESDEARARFMPWLEDQVERLPERRAEVVQTARKQRVRRIGATACGLAAAAAALLYLGRDSNLFGEHATNGRLVASLTPQESDDFVTLVSGQVQSGTIDVLAGSRLGLTSRVTTNEHESAQLQGKNGYEVRLSPESNFAFKGKFPAPPGQVRVRLDAGHAEFSVPKLAPGHSFVVETVGAEIRVVGTTFSVSSGERPCVRVSEGSVAVSNENGGSVLLKPGESWGCDAGAEATLDPSKVKSSSRVEVPGAGSQRTTTLAQENALLSRALSEESKGNESAARKAFLELIERYPRSPFVTDARAGLARVSEKNP